MNNEAKWAPVGLPCMEAFFSPISYRQDSSHHDIPWVSKGGFKQLLVKEIDMKKKKRNRHEFE